MQTSASESDKRSENTDETLGSRASVLGELFAGYDVLVPGPTLHVPWLLPARPGYFIIFACVVE